MRQFLLVFPLILCLAGCSESSGSGDSVREFNSRIVVLPDGTKISAEVNTNHKDMARGMMFRDTLPEGQGMLFIHGSPNTYPYWMWNVKVPLDIIWMDQDGRVVEVAENAQPCQKVASQCPNYGGNARSMVVLELPGGTARRHGIYNGALVRF